MFQSFFSFLDELRRAFRIADAIDIAVITVILYSALVWFKRTASRRMAVGGSLLVAIYFLARTFDLYLTSLLFHAGFAVLLVMLVVVFQEDIRRVFERLATWETLQDLWEDQKMTTDLNTIVEAAYTLATGKTGALIVLQGRESLDRYVEGGIALSGRLSKPLLYSIFDPHSLGHDGAVIIHQDRVERFAVHLPISKNRKELGLRGTRHSAALGLSECSDALAIVVSEERGIVSVAERGKLQELRSSLLLKQRLVQFFADRFPKRAEPSWKRIVTWDARLKAVSLVMACLAWLVLAHNAATIQQTFDVPIEYRNIPKNLALDEFAPDKARITLSGSERAYRFLEPGSLRLSIDLSKAPPGRDLVTLSEKNIKLPSNLNVYRIEPRIISIELHGARTQTSVGS